jgi:hypothetical protein
MRKVLVVLSFLVFSCLLWKSLETFRNVKVLKEENLATQERIKSSQINLKHLEGMFDDPIDSIIDNYANLNEQLSRFCQFNSLNALLDLKQSGKEGLLLESVSEASWPGINKVLVNINFYKMKGLDQFLTIYKFLETIEDSNPLIISAIKQKKDFLEVEVQLFGRSL